MLRNRCAADGCRSAGSRPICLPKATLLVSYTASPRSFQENPSAAQRRLWYFSELLDARARTCSDLPPAKD